MNLRNTIAALAAVILLAFSSVTLAEVTQELGSESVMTVNVNEADAQTIADTLVGVGMSRAQAIVDYREKYGRFYSAEELTAVKGIGQSTVEKNLSRITIK